MTEPTRRAWASIDGKALLNNLAQVRALSPASQLFPVIKANAYGHGMAEMAQVLAASPIAPAGLAVATLSEAVCLQQLGKDRQWQLPILLLNGFIDADELALCLELELEPVIHAPYQVELLEKAFAKRIFGGKRKLWLKLNTGMNRLGMSAEECLEAWQRLRKYPGVEFVLMSHLAWADETDTAASRQLTGLQLQRFAAMRDKLRDKGGDPLPCSLAASSGVYALPEAHYQIVRPGIMLYGSSPLPARTGEEIGLRSVMTLSSRLIDIKEVAAGESIGYGATYTCDRRTRLGVVSIGYGDGYPRAAGNGTPVLVKTASGSTRSTLIGRVSMDMISIDLSAIPDARINDEVVLWGEGLCIDEIARASNTIAYELMCKITPRVTRVYRNL